MHVPHDALGDPLVEGSEDAFAPDVPSVNSPSVGVQEHSKARLSRGPHLVGHEFHAFSLEPFDLPEIKPCPTTVRFFNFGLELILEESVVVVDTGDGTLAPLAAYVALMLGVVGVRGLHYGVGSVMAGSAVNDFEVIFSDIVDKLRIKIQSRFNDISGFSFREDILDAPINIFIG